MDVGRSFASLTRTMDDFVFTSLVFRPSSLSLYWAHLDSPPEADQPLAENQAPQSYQDCALTSAKNLLGDSGLEPDTSVLSGLRSNQLS